MQYRFLAAALSALSLSDSASAGPFQRSTCNQNNCLRAFTNHGSLAGPFCDSYATAPTPTTAFPVFAAPCSAVPSKISSACKCLGSSGAAPTPPPRGTCAKTSYYRGWKDIKYAFIFGDSYTTTGFNNTGVQPSSSNPLGNPTYPGYTAANGPNWVDFLTVEYNASLLETYNLAYGGATVDSALVAPYLPTVSSVAEQVENEFFPTYASKSAPAWTSSDSLFGVFIGINDVGNSYYQGLPATTSLNQNIFAVYEGLMQMLYNTGARNFLFINVPPVDRSPLSTANDAASQALEKADIAAFNADIISMAHSLKTQHSDINIFTVNSNSLFTEVLDKPASFPQTSIYKNTTAYCAAYANGTPAEDTFYANCSIPVNEYFWLNSLHPTYPMQNVLAQAVGEQLTAGPNIC